MARIPKAQPGLPRSVAALARAKAAKVARSSAAAAKRNKVVPEEQIYKPGLGKKVAEKTREKQPWQRSFADNFNDVRDDFKSVAGKKTSFGTSDIKAKIRKDYEGFKKGGTIKKMKNGGKSPAWQRKEGKNPSGGLNAKGVASYRAANPGSKLKMAVTTPPSKLKKDSKAAKRRKSFCARSAGQMAKFPKAAKDPNSRLRLARKKWNC
jgi:hypothetical protein